MKNEGQGQTLLKQPNIEGDSKAQLRLFQILPLKRGDADNKVFMTIVGRCHFIIDISQRVDLLRSAMKMVV